MSDFTSIPKTRDFNGKRYTLRDSFVLEGTAQRLKAQYKKQGYQVRIYQKGGVMHAIRRYHVYVRKGG